MHFRLRTLLVATTAVAIYVGGSLGIARTLSMWRGAVRLGSINYVYLLADLPTFVLWVVGAVWAFDRRERPGMKALLWGLVLAAAWRFASPLAQAAVLQPILASGGSHQAVFAAFTLFNTLVQTASWAMLLYAFIKASEPRSAPVSPLKVSPAESRDC
jgi:hypothetical protein